MAVQQGLRTARDTARSAARQAYDDLDAAGGLANGNAVKGMAGRIAAAVRMQGSLRTSTTPQASSAALEEIGAAFRGLNTPGGPQGSIPFTGSSGCASPS